MKIINSILVLLFCVLTGWVIAVQWYHIKENINFLISQPEVKK